MTLPTLSAASQPVVLALIREVSPSDDRKSGHLYEQDGGLADGAPQPDTVWSMRFSLKHDDVGVATGAAQAPSFDVPVVVSSSKRFHTWFPFGGARVGNSIAVMHQAVDDSCVASNWSGNQCPFRANAPYPAAVFSSPTGRSWKEQCEPHDPRCQLSTCPFPRE